MSLLINSSYAVSVSGSRRTSAQDSAAKSAFNFSILCFVSFLWYSHLCCLVLFSIFWDITKIGRWSDTSEYIIPLKCSDSLTFENILSIRVSELVDILVALLM